MRHNGIFQAESYKAYVRDWLEAHSERGLKARLAESGGFQSTYLSQVLGGEKHFSLEQADQVARFMAMSESEHACFLLMVNHERAGSPTLRRHYQKQLEELRGRVEQFTERVPREQRQQLAPEQQALYYSSWVFAAVHIALTLEVPLSPRELASKLAVSEAKIQMTLRELESMGLAVFDGENWRVGQARLHVSTESPLLEIHHRNLRELSTRPREVKPADFRYSSVVTLTKADAELIRAELVNLIAAHRARIQASAEEVMYCYNLDFFVVIDR